MITAGIRRALRESYLVDIEVAYQFTDYAIRLDAHLNLPWYWQCVAPNGVVYSGWEPSKASAERELAAAVGRYCEAAKARMAVAS